MPIVDRLSNVQWAAVVASVLAIGVTFWTAAADIVNLPKATISLWAAAVIAVVAAARFAISGRARVGPLPLLVPAASFVAALVVAALAADAPSVALFGTYGRWSGLLPYLSFVIIGLAVAARARVDDLSGFVVALAVSCGGVVAYGLLQFIGADPVPWVNDYGDAFFSSLGNPNFAAGFLAITTPAALYLTLDDRWPGAARAASGAVAVGAVVAIWLTDAIQGPAALAAALAVFSLAWVRSRQQPLRRKLTAAWLAAALGAAVLLGAVVVGMGPFAGLGVQRTLELRTWYWRAAISMFRDHPITGVGIGRYGSYYQEHRPPEAAAQFALSDTTDAAHNVLLNLAAEGGLLVAASWLAIVLVTATALVMAFRRSEGRELLLFGALGGAWAAYQVQALVSIDVPALALLHFAVSGGLVGLVFRESKVIQAPWAASVQPPRKGRRRRRPQPLGTKDRIVVGAAALLVLVLMTVATRPLRADMALSDSRQALAQGDAAAALERAERADELAPWEPTYDFQRGQVLAQLGRTDEAIEAFRAAAATEPRSLSAVVTTARYLDNTGRPEEAEEWYRRALDIEPKHPEMKVEVAKFLLQGGDLDEGLALVEEALDVHPERPDWWALLGRAQVAAGDEEAGRRSLEHALELKPEQADAEEALRLLDGESGSG